MSNETSRRILFTGGGGAGSSALYDLLRYQQEVHFCDADPFTRHPTIPIDQFHTIPLAHEPDFLPALKKIVKAYRINLLIPAVDEELLHLADADLGDCQVLLPDRKFVATHIDKGVSSRFFESKGIRAPRTLDAAVEVNQIIKELSFPLILKPKRGRGSKGVQIVENIAQFENIKATSNIDLDNYVAQQLIIGEEFTVTVSASRLGVLKAIVPVKVHEKRGITIKAEISRNPVIEDYCRLIHASLPTKGVYNVQLILSPAGLPFCFEINPRISTTSCLALAGGVNFISNYFSEDQHFFHDYNDRLTLTRFYMNEFRDRGEK